MQIFDEIWYNTDGSIALQYDISGYCLSFPVQQTTMEFTSSVTVEADNSVGVAYTIDFKYNEQTDKISTTEKWLYKWNDQSKKFYFSEEDSQLPWFYSPEPNQRRDDFGILGKYYEFMEIADTSIHVSEEEWRKMVSNAIK